MKLLAVYNQILRESIGDNNQLWYHGSSSKIPFQHFDKNMDGSGYVTLSKGKYNGFFFTSEADNAEFYSEYFICSVIINEIFPSPMQGQLPSNVLKQGNIDNKIYRIDDMLDGAIYSDIAVVPYSKLNNVKIKEWIFIGDKEFYFERLDKLFGGEEDFVNKDIILDTCESIEIDINFLLTIPIWNEYFNSK